MAVVIKGQKIIKTLIGDSVIELDGIGIPTQLRINFSNPVLFDGDIIFYQSCLIPETSEVIKAKKNAYSLQIRNIQKDKILPISEQTKGAFADITISHLIEALKAFYIISSSENELIYEGIGGINGISTI